MKRIYLAGAFLLAFAHGVSEAGAVDIINMDAVSYKLNVTEKGVTIVHELLPGDEFPQVCHVCLLSVEDDVDLPAEGDVRVVIEDGRLKIVKKRR